jgi:uncharacterized Zn finger protein
MTYSIVAILRDISLKNVTLSSNLNYGKAIYERGAIELVKMNDSEIEILVGGLAGKSIEGGGSKRRVRFWLEKDQLSWRCTGNPKDHEIFCKHCVAATLFLKDESKKKI